MRTRFILACLAFLAVPVCQAQFGTGAILGNVTDPTGASVVGAKVTIRNKATNETRNADTDTEGFYRVSSLPSGNYTVSATAPSFRVANVSDVVLTVNTQVRVDIGMQLGQVTESVAVTGTTPQLQTNTAALGTVIDNRTMLELPLNARNFFDLVALTPGAVKTSGTSSVMDERSIEIGGVRNTSTGASLDGVDFTVVNQNNPGIALSLDALAEFKVQSNFMDAAYGHGAAFIDMVTKRGTNSFHGVVYEFARNREFQAGQFFRPATGAPRFTYSQFGANAGGAIIKDKTFYFGNYEARRRRTGVILQGLIPTAEMLAGDFSATGKTIRDPLNGGTPFANNVIPRTRFDGITQQLIQYFPKPNLTGRPGVNFLTTPSDWERRDQFTGRIDHILSTKGNLFGRYSFADDKLANAAYIVGLGLIRPDRTQHLALGYTHVFTPNFISDTRLGFFKAYLARTSDGDRFSKNYAAELGLKNLAAGPGDYTLPNINLTGYAPGFPTGTGGFVGYGFRIVQNNIYYRGAETVTWMHGNHTVKIGGEYSHLLVGYDQGNNQNGTISFSGNYSGDSTSDYLLGVPASATGGVGSLGNYGGVAKYALADQVFGFVQDDWRLNNKLTLNLGLRYEYQSPYRGRLANFDLFSGRQNLAGIDDYFEPGGAGLVQRTGKVVLNNPPVKADRNNWSPRLGLAYRATSNTVIRAGAGVFYAFTGGGAAVNNMQSTPPYFVFVSLVSSPTTPQIRMSDLFPGPEKTTSAVNSNQDLNQRTGYLFNYNFNIQHQVRPGLLFETGYIGNTGQKQYGSVLMNQPRLPRDPANPDDFRLRMPFPKFNPGFTMNTNYQWSNYNAGFLKFEQRVWNGLSYIVAYTYSKLVDSGAAGMNMYDRRPERELASNHFPHNFILSYVWQIPVGKGRGMNVTNKVLDGVIGGWQLSGITNFRSGPYLTIGVAGDLANVVAGEQRANATGVAASRLNPRTSGLLGFDRAAYATPARNVFGNLGRNTQQGFGVNNWDVSINKDFPIKPLGEAGRFQLRLEWFNFFNHAQFNNPAATVNVANFGLVNSARDPRILQLAGKLYW